MDVTPTTGVIITGGASGIGLASAAALAAQGRPVALWDLGEDRVQAAVESIAGSAPVVGYAIDVTDRAGVERVIGATRTALGSIGALVHSAGNIISEPIGQIDWGNWSSQLDVHLNSLARIVQDILPDLREHPGSAIVAISSINGLVAESFNPAYCTAKAGMLGLTRSMASHLGPEGIRVNAICPGYIVTPITQRSRSNPDTLKTWTERAALKRLGEPDEIGSVARFLLSGEASFITGQTIVVDGGTISTA
jgi:NAD(P)-dependent dehydrogenase (short-subunit alcohol dehydrogenase family)